MDSPRSHEYSTSLTPVLDRLSIVLGNVDCFLFLIALHWQCVFLVCVLKLGAPNFESWGVCNALVLCHQFCYSIAKLLAVAASPMVFENFLLLLPGTDTAHRQRQPMDYLTNNCSIRQSCTHLANQVAVWINVSCFRDALFEPFEFLPLVFDPH